MIRMSSSVILPLARSILSIECEACEKACPVNVPLMLLNRAMARTVKRAFDYEAGKDPDLQPPLRTFDLKDDNSFIL